MSIEIGIAEPVINALSTPEGWIGLLLGLGGRETVRALRGMWQGFQQARADGE